MKALTLNEVMSNILKILEQVQNGEEILIRNAQNQESIAVIIPYQKYLKKQERTLGILKGKASYQIKTDFKMTDEEMLTL